MSLLSLLDVPAPAKLNLFLHIVGRRPDGYHLLQSLFVMIDWCDTLHFELRSDGQLARHDLAEPLPADDLCLRAARLLQAESGTRAGADISIAKHVPSGAGMGGGSSDAASTLLALNRLWGLNWPRDRLQALGLRLGADVPFFLGGGPAFVEGIGERLTPVAVPPMMLAVVKPVAGIETRAIFHSPLLVRNTEAVILEGLLATSFSGVDNFGRNDLQHAAVALCPEVGDAVKWLQGHFGNGRMTGSGSAVFARVANKNDGSGLHPIDAEIPADLPATWVARICRSLEHHPLAGWADSAQGCKV